MSSSILLSFLCCLLICTAGGGSAQATEETAATISNAIVLLSNVPPIEGRSFCCDSMVHAVNGLRHLGKEDALKALRLYLGEHGSHPFSDESEKVVLICRLLFSNPGGWQHPKWGQPYPEVNRDTSAKNPIFPLILSHGMPFILIEGYEGSGYTDETADKCLRTCEAFNLITNDLPGGDYKAAATTLVKSEEFRALYSSTNELAFMEKMIFAQTHCPNVMARRADYFKSSIDVKMWSMPQTNN